MGYKDEMVNGRLSVLRSPSEYKAFFVVVFFLIISIALGYGWQ